MKNRTEQREMASVIYEYVYAAVYTISKHVHTCVCILYMCKSNIRNKWNMEDVVRKCAKFK